MRETQQGIKNISAMSRFASPRCKGFGPCIAKPLNPTGYGRHRVNNRSDRIAVRIKDQRPECYRALSRGDFGMKPRVQTRPEPSAARFHLPPLSGACKGRALRPSVVLVAV